MLTFFSTGPHSAIAYKRTVEQIELFTKYFHLLVSVSGALCVCSFVPYTYVRYFIYDMGAESFYLFYLAWFVINLSSFMYSIKRILIFFSSILIRYPFDWKTPFGYFVASLSQLAGILCLSCLYSHFFNCIFGSVWLFICIAKDVKMDLIAFNVAVKTSDVDEAELTKRFLNVTQIYSDAKE